MACADCKHSGLGEIETKKLNLCCAILFGSELAPLQFESPLGIAAAVTPAAPGGIGPVAAPGTLCPLLPSSNSITGPGSTPFAAAQG